MTTTSDLFNPGDAVLICGATKRRVGRVVWRERTCSEDGLPTYRVELGGGLEGEFCESVLARSNEQ